MSRKRWRKNYAELRAQKGASSYTAGLWEVLGTAGLGGSPMLRPERTTHPALEDKMGKPLLRRWQQALLSHSALYAYGRRWSNCRISGFRERLRPDVKVYNEEEARTSIESKAKQAPAGWSSIRNRDGG